jgi:hypothetical protein
MTTALPLTARPIRFTADIPGWSTILETLGAGLVSEHPGWLVYQLGGGRLALHAASEAQPVGTTLGMETGTPLADAVAAASEAGVPVTLEDTDHGPAGVVRAVDGTSFCLDSPTANETGASTREPRLSVLQIWYAPDTSVPLSTLRGLGARPRVVADDGRWVDLLFPGGGLAAVHQDESAGTELAFEWDGDVEEVVGLLADAGVRSTLIDESYSRTVQVQDPDGGKAIWVNQRQTDLYGYRLATG